jgi:hypothetical protein
VAYYYKNCGGFGVTIGLVLVHYELMLMKINVHNIHVLNVYQTFFPRQLMLGCLISSDLELIPKPWFILTYSGDLERGIGSEVKSSSQTMFMLNMSQTMVNIKHNYSAIWNLNTH